MTPTLVGRIQTRLFLLATVGVVWTIIVTPALPRGTALPGESTMGELYSVTFGALVLVAVLGAAIWEPIYHALQQYRWEKDWPTLFGLLTGVPEGILAFLILDNMMMDTSGVATPSTFWTHFITTWLLVWLAANGPMRVLMIRWRYRGGRLG
ncbi:MAG: hypothetical protein AAF480_10335 [Actinomycetota bacterium]